MAPVDRTSPLPLYEQVKADLLGRLRDGEFAPGARLPSEAELCDEYRVSRIVVRQALAELSQRGYVVPRQGKGTYAGDPKVHARFLHEPSSFFSDLASLGYDVSSRLEVLELQAAGEASAAMGLRPEDEVVAIERVRTVDGELFAITRSLIPAWLGSDIMAVLRAADLEHASLDAVVSKTFSTRIATASRTVEATIADAALAARMGLPEGAAVLLVRSLGRDDKGRVVELYEAWHRGDRAVFEIAVENDQSSAKTSIGMVNGPSRRRRTAEAAGAD